RRSLPDASPWPALHEQLLGELDALPLEDRLQSAIALVHSQRGEVSRQFFARFTDGTPAQQDLIAHFGLYREPLLDLIDSLVLPDRALAIEIGPGEGGFLPDLAGRFTRVLALDNAPAMQGPARQQRRQAGPAQDGCQRAPAL